MALALEWIARSLPLLHPRTTCALRTLPPVIVFTDGACEPGPNGGLQVTVGGLLISPGRRREFFALDVEESRWRQWAGDIARQVIGQAEVYPTLVARYTWEAELKDKSVVYFVDNDSARQALIRRVSSVEATASLLWDIADFDIRLQSCPWYERVASASNPGDLPSRRKRDETARRFGAVEVTPVLSRTGK